MASISSQPPQPIVPDAEMHAPGGAVSPAQIAAEVAQARRLAERYRLPFVEMDEFHIDNDLFRSIPAELTVFGRVY